MISFTFINVFMFDQKSTNNWSKSGMLTVSKADAIQHFMGAFIQFPLINKLRRFYKLRYSTAEDWSKFRTLYIISAWKQKSKHNYKIYKIMSLLSDNVEDLALHRWGGEGEAGEAQTAPRLGWCREDAADPPEETEQEASLQPVSLCCCLLFGPSWFRFWSWSAPRSKSPAGLCTHLNELINLFCKNNFPLDLKLFNHLVPKTVRLRRCVLCVMFQVLRDMFACLQDWTHTHMKTPMDTFDSRNCIHHKHLEKDSLSHTVHLCWF